MRAQRLVLSLACIAIPSLAFDGAVHPFNPTADAPPIRRTGNPAEDNGATCLVCHAGTPLNGGPGRLTIRATPYTPGIRQTVEVDIRDANAVKWGFQLIARYVNDPLRQAGTFTADVDTRVRCGPAGATYAPCAGQLEYATHSLGSTEPGRAGGKTFRIEWMPPADGGEVMFYAAGNASNNNGANTGDRIYSTTYAIPAANCTLTGTPTIQTNGVADAASFRTVISPNALISIFGLGLFSPSATRAATANDLLGGRLPSEMSCVAVEVDGRRAPLIFLSSGQINAQAPTATPEGTSQVRVILNPGRSNEIRSTTAPVQVSGYSPALFVNGPIAAAINATTGQVISASAPAKPGDIISVYGTGFGVTDPVYQAGEFAVAPLRDPVRVTIRGTVLPASEVLFAGQSPEAPGFNQFNIRLPADLPNGDASITIGIGSATSQSGVVIPIAR